MPSPIDPLRLRQEDLFSSEVESYLEERAALREPPAVAPQAFIVRLLYSSYFYLSVAGAVGALCAWAILEPFINEHIVRDGEQVGTASLIAFFLGFPTVAGFVGMFLGAVEGVMCRNFRRALLCASVGLAIGFGLGLVSYILAEILFVIMQFVALPFWKDPHLPPTGLALLIVMMGRSLAWSVAAVPAGIGQGIALWDRKIVLNGLLGGVLGGLLGGLLFDPIEHLFRNADGSAGLSRAIGFAVIGVLVGLFIGLVEHWTKTAWLLMRAGPLAGKQFVIYRNPTVLGSSPKADIYLFKDDAIEPQHALIHNRGGRFEIEDKNSPDGTYVNGYPVRKQFLQAGDQIVLGKTVLEFSLKEAR